MTKVSCKGHQMAAEVCVTYIIFTKIQYTYHNGRVISIFMASLKVASWASRGLQDTLPLKPLRARTTQKPTEPTLVYPHTSAWD